jgi:hypothetical protein
MGTNNRLNKIWIPEVSEDRIKELARRIKPIVEFRGQGKCYIESVNLFDTAYTCDPKSTGRAQDIKPLRDIRTYHKYSFALFFKPSIAEVLAQIPEECLDRVIAFEIVESPETVDDINNEPEARVAGYHVATTRLYVQG